MNDVWVIARKEILELRRDRLFAILVAFLALASIVSVAVASGAFRVQLDAYNAYVAQLAASGSTTEPAAPQLYPLQMLRGAIEYLEILGALFAIVIGYGVVAREKQRGTLQLLLSRPLRQGTFPFGKVLGLAIIWFAVVAALTIVETLAITIIGAAPLSALDLVRIALAALGSWLYLVFWSAIAVGVTSITSRLSTGLIVSIVLWLSVVLILPQIGDTMDPDNQVPGGLFASLQIQKPDEHQVLAHFAAFDAIRNGIEVASVTKHFERFTFAFTGIKDMYNQQSLAFVWADMWPYALTLMAATVAAVIFAAAVTTRRNLLRRTS